MTHTNMGALSRAQRQAAYVTAAALTSFFIGATEATADSIVDSERAAEVTFEREPEFLIRITGKIDDELANKVTDGLYAIAKKDPDQEIFIEISSGGGEVIAGWNILNAIRTIPNKVTTICQRAESMAAMILTLNPGGDRYAYPDCRIMLHEPSAGVSGTASAIVSSAENVGDVREKFIVELAEATGQSLEVARDLISTGDTVFQPLDAYNLNMIDGILPGRHNPARAIRPMMVSAEFCTEERVRIMSLCKPNSGVEHSTSVIASSPTASAP